MIYCSCSVSIWAKSGFFGVTFIAVSLRSMAVLSNRAQERRSHEKFARTSGEAARKLKTARPDSWSFQLPPPSTHFDNSKW